jgi:putative membrane protein
VIAAVLAWTLATAGIAYAAGVGRSARRGRWPVQRTAAWYGGLVAAGVGGTLAASDAPATHATGHLLLGMLAPLLLVLAAPVTLALRALPAERARLLSRVLRCGPVAVLTHPFVAGVLDVGGLWVIYTTGLHAIPGLGLHVLAAGYLFTASIVGVDPAPHRSRPAVRAVALVLASAAHGTLAKHLYATGWGDGAMVMYYGGDAVELLLAVLLCRRWLTAADRSRLRRVQPA